MTLGQKIRELRESKGMFQRQLASILEVGDGFLSKVETDQKALKREHLKTISETFNCSFSELEALWIGSKIYDIVKDEKEGMNALKVAEQQMKYEKKIK
ncbi:MAG: helix-turn-helix transcriptional regulator [Crocinitomicaceae bacterium]